MEAAVRPLHLRLDLQKNFLDGETPNDASDPGIHGFAKNPGHGTGTIGILAGGSFTFTNEKYSFSALLGGAPYAEVVPVRVANGQSRAVGSRETGVGLPVWY